MPRKCMAAPGLQTGRAALLCCKRGRAGQARGGAAASAQTHAEHEHAERHAALQGRPVASSAAVHQRRLHMACAWHRLGC